MVSVVLQFNHIEHNLTRPTYTRLTPRITLTLSRRKERLSRVSTSEKNTDGT